MYRLWSPSDDRRWEVGGASVVTAARSRRYNVFFLADSHYVRSVSIALAWAGQTSRRRQKFLFLLTLQSSWPHITPPSPHIPTSFLPSLLTDGRCSIDEFRHGEQKISWRRQFFLLIMPPPPASWTLTFDLKSGVRVTCDVGYLCANFIFLGLSVLDLGPMYVTDRRASSLNASALWERGHNK